MREQSAEAEPLYRRFSAEGTTKAIGRLTPCMAFESSMLALGSGDLLGVASAVLLPTNRRLGCFGTATGSSAILSSADGPRFVAALSSSMLARRVVACRARGGVDRMVGQKKLARTRLANLEPLDHDQELQSSLEFSPLDVSPFVDVSPFFTCIFSICLI